MSLPKYLCIMLYVKLMSCCGLPCIYGRLEGGHSVIKLIWCSGLPWICGQLEEGWGQSVMKIMQCNGLPGEHVQLTGGVPQCSSLPCICGSIGGRGGISLSWKLGSIMVFQISMLSWGGYLWHLFWTLHLKIWTHSLIPGLGLSVHFIWALHLKMGGISESEHFIWKFEHTCHFMLCFPEGLFILHTKDLISRGSIIAEHIIYKGLINFMLGSFLQRNCYQIISYFLWNHKYKFMTFLALCICLLSQLDFIILV